MRPRGIGPLVAAVLAVLLAAGGVRGQEREVAFSPRSDREAERQLAEFLDRGGYRLWTRDTVVAAGDTVAGPLLVLDASVRMSGRLEGEVFVVAGDLFLRPDARLTGDVRVLAGGYYASSLATVEGRVEYRPNLLLGVERRADGGWRIVPVGEDRPVVDLDGLYGVHVPHYRRVDGWTLGWGGRVQGHDLPGRPSLEAAVRFHTESERQWEGTVRQFWHPAADFRLGMEVERRTATMDRWIQRDVPNTFSYLFGGDDFRNYYRSERATLEVGWPGRSGWGGAFRVNWEEAESLEARALDVFFEDDEDVRPNPPVDEGKIWSLEGALGYRARSARSRFMAEVRAEAADSTAAGDFSFLLGEARLAWRRPGLPGHRFELFGIARYDLAGSLPRQRWSGLGGEGTLPTLGVLERRGPRMFFLASTYLVPIRALRVPVFGPPRIFLRNSVGAAWREDGTLRVEDNVVTGVRIFFLEAGLAVDVTASDLDPELVIGGRFPTRFWE